MDDPVICSDGQAYERQALTVYVASQQPAAPISAITRQPLLTYGDGSLVMFSAFALR